MLISRLKRARSRRGYSYFGGFGGCCCSNPTTFCAYGCGATPITGAVVTVGSYSPCTTGPGNCCSINGITTGTYNVTVVDGSTTIYNQSLSITTGHTYSLSASCCIKVCLACCDGSAYPYGATVTIKNASTGAAVASGTTDSTGCVTISLATSDLNPTSSQAIIAVTANCSLYADSSATYSPVCSQTINITMFAADSTAICCSSQGSCIPIGTNLTITDANGSWPFVKLGGGGPWYACYRTSANPTQQASWNNTLGQCVSSAVYGTYPTRVEYYGAPSACYAPICGKSGGSGTFTVERVWYSPDGVNYHGAATSGSDCDDCSSAVSNTYCSYGTAAMPTGCSPFAVSVSSMTLSGSYPLPDPVGGGVSIS